MRKGIKKLHEVLLFAPVALAAEEGVALVNPLGSSDVRVIIGYLIQAALGVSGTIALAFFIWGGFLWLTSQGNTDKIKKGRDTLIWAAIGLAIIFSGYTLTNAIMQRILQAS